MSLLTTICSSARDECQPGFDVIALTVRHLRAFFWIEGLDLLNSFMLSPMYMQYIDTVNGALTLYHGVVVAFSLCALHCRCHPDRRVG